MSGGGGSDPHKRQRGSGDSVPGSKRRRHGRKRVHSEDGKRRHPKRPRHAELTTAELTTAERDALVVRYVDAQNNVVDRLDLLRQCAARASETGAMTIRTCKGGNTGSLMFRVDVATADGTKYHMSARVMLPSATATLPSQFATYDGTLHSTSVSADGDPDAAVYFRPDTIYNELILNKFDMTISEVLHGKIVRGAQQIQGHAYEWKYHASEAVMMSILPPLDATLGSLIENADYCNEFVVMAGIQIARALANCRAAERVYPDVNGTNVYYHHGMYFGEDVLSIDLKDEICWKNIHVVLQAHERTVALGSTRGIIRTDKDPIDIAPEARCAAGACFDKADVWSLGMILWQFMWRRGTDDVSLQSATQIQEKWALATNYFKQPTTYVYVQPTGTGTSFFRATAQKTHPQWFKIFIQLAIKRFLHGDPLKRPSLDVAVCIMEVLFAAIGVSAAREREPTITLAEYIVEIQFKLNSVIEEKEDDKHTVYDILQLGVHGMLDAKNVVSIVEVMTQVE